MSNNDLHEADAYKEQKKKMNKKATLIYQNIWKAFNLPIPEMEYKFHSTRKWRFDYCFPEKRLAIEIEGGVFTNGRHTRGVGFVNDMEKYNAAIECGYVVLRYTPKSISFEQIARVFMDRINI